MHVAVNVKSPNNISEWQMGFNSAFKGLTYMLKTNVSSTDVYNQWHKIQCFRCI